jgi:hypothetical protein
VSWARERIGAESARASSRDGRFGRVVRVPDARTVDSTRLLAGSNNAMLLVFRELQASGVVWRLASYGER